MSTEGVTAYDWWAKAHGQGSYKGLTIHEGEPQCGYYRIRRKDGGFSAVSIYWYDGQLVALKDGEEVDPEQIWTWCLKYPPISYELYKSVVEDGGEWPENMPPMIGSNSGEDLTPDAALKSELDERAVQFRKWLQGIGGKIATAEQAAKAGSFFKWFQARGGKADKDREAEKRPHLNACRAVDNKWNPLVTLAKNLAAEANKPVTEYLMAERKRQEAERRAAETAALLKAQEEAAQRARDLPPHDEDGVIQEQSPIEPARVEAPEPVRVTTDMGRNIGLTVIKKVHVSDLDALLAHYVRDGRFRDHTDVARLLTRFAKEDLTSGKDVPGAELVEDARAA